VGGGGTGAREGEINSRALKALLKEKGIKKKNTVSLQTAGKESFARGSFLANAAGDGGGERLPRKKKESTQKKKYRRNRRGPLKRQP